MAEKAIKCSTCEHKVQYAMGLLYHAYRCGLSQETPKLEITRHVNTDVFIHEKNRPEQCPLDKP